ncbi:LysR family transcriptional regulator [Paenibacillus sacheonensis]|uniref:LysR family transcriptional regulator n=1 Tax=Paenibacillus sacheonensis TaxID=742054 RepID=A0A7X4YSW5_9BACL|nr:LysR family transcriptional regulator [Paenibacillus sacheonensis]MBM7567779.1 DNA-binding transcriptional LysR family regulator [Paenibacillus sacheonensis]NBC71951.1 LysR family transcriptional regulator [Paenibacillus sacheonensis]
MDIRQLRYFIAIVEERSISAAARRLFLSQPPISQLLKAMETELGAKLVERSGKYIEVTEAGKALYKYALQMDQLMEEAKMEVKEVGNGVNGRLTVGVNTFSVAELPEILLKFQQHYPKVTYKIQQNESAHLCRLVRDREVELAFIRLPLGLDDFSVLHLYSEPFYLITSKNRQPYGNEVSLADIEHQPLLLPSTQGLGVHYLISEAFSRFHLSPRIVGECSDIVLLMDLVSSGFCASIVPETLLRRHKGHAIRARRISGSGSTEMTSPVGLIWLKNHRLSKTAQHFIDFLQEAMEGAAHPD